MQNVETGNWVDIDISDHEIGCGDSVESTIHIRNNSESKKTYNFSVKTEFTQRDDLIEWQHVFIGSIGSGKRDEISVSPSDNKEYTAQIPLEKKEIREIRWTVTTPKGGFKTDSAKFTLEVVSTDQAHRILKQMQITLIPVIVAVKTTVGNEVAVARDLAKKGDRDKEERASVTKNVINEILAIMAPKDVKGYIFVETMHPDRIPYLGKGIRGYKGEVKGEISIEEIEHYLEPKPAVTGLELGAFVELIDGPFKGERAKIMSIDSAKEEVTVQLIESLVPIPVTVNAEAIRMLDTK